MPDRKDWITTGDSVVDEAFLLLGTWLLAFQAGSSQAGSLWDRYLNFWFRMTDAQCDRLNDQLNEQWSLADHEALDNRLKAIERAATEMRTRLSKPAPSGAQGEGGGKCG